MTDGPDKGRRIWLRAALSVPAALVLPATGRAMSAGGGARELSFHHTHTNEKISLVYAHDGRPIPQALARINEFLRDFRSGEIHPIDPALFDILYDIRLATGSHGVFEVISGYRSPTTNAMLRKRGSGVARKSLHMQGRAIDVRLSGVDTAAVRDAARALARGGVGFYGRSDFVHLDTGRVRHW
ncbi:MAG: DUF882 domain-containing protein [Gammaproteobacteria bacterium]|nr:DUF882 domain-containing protein [Gammaproteobacteria bacterium]